MKPNKVVKKGDKPLWMMACTKTRNNETKRAKRNPRNHRNERNETTETSKIVSK